jgi:hypothetical protein
VKVAFHSSYLGYRGTEIALMDYARGNQEMLGNESFFLMPWRDGCAEHPVVRRMEEIAPLHFYRSTEEREGVLREEGADFFYCIKNGFNDGAFSRKVPTGIHAIFRESEFHGDIYAYVSPWLSDVMSYGKAPWVPHMVRLTEDNGDLRMEDRGQRPEGGGRRREGGDRKSVVGDRWSEVVIPQEVTVFGRHGGDDSFDIPWVQEAVVEIAKKNPNIWFLFLNTREFRGAVGMPNIVFLPATADPFLKKRFLNTCDAMLHGRMRGETFGLSCLEFAVLGKPVLTFGDSPEKAHLEILGEAAVAYHNAKELREFLCHPASVIRRRAFGGDWRAEDGGQMAEDGGQRAEDRGQRTEDGGRRAVGGGRKSVNGLFSSYEPEAVMKKFQEVFLT